MSFPKYGFSFETGGDSAVPGILQIIIGRDSAVPGILQIIKIGGDSAVPGILQIIIDGDSAVPGASAAVGVSTMVLHHDLRFAALAGTPPPLPSCTPRTSRPTSKP